MHRVSALVLAASCLVCSPAVAQTDAAAAEALFQEGRALQKQGRYAEACGKLADSFGLDPATGTLVALALCHEQQKKLASAWAEFTAAAARSKREGRADRERLSVEHAAALKPRLSTLTVIVPEALRKVQGLRITRDGAPLGESGWGSAVPIGGGEHVVQASAPGYAAQEQRVQVRAEAENAKVTLLALTPEEGAEPKAPRQNQEPIQSPPADAAAPSADAAAPKSGWNSTQWVGVASFGAGLAALGVSGYFLASGLSNKSKASPYCDGNRCLDTGADLMDDARRDGNLATLFGIGGAVFVATGVTLFVVGHGTGRAETNAAQTAWSVRTDGRTLSVTGVF